MAKYHLSKKAVDDLANIWSYTYDEWSERQADKYYKLLIDSCQEIANNPLLGKSYTEIADSLFGYKSGEHIIFYLIIDKKEIEVVRILHGRMDIKQKF
ncbi:plasmid stabilization protein ParE [Flavobacterium suaedae]|uniref:Toxin n=1 Tax=Flavobacterium suaedae TaxID=1767027 RepID=A0ABQ1JG42_9FLAO|nr:type II toxin-antitoxin system RelE/ParE family toxin [Flavobacterium suaedae]GGB67685.1 plasmid stabilization protein ParE [Flavobacterium suaedae]